MSEENGGEIRVSEEKWQEVSAKLGNVSLKTKMLAREICDDAWANGHDVWFLWGDGQEMDHKLNHTTDHGVLDFMVHTKAAGKHVRDYSWTHRKRLGVKHVIWDQHVTSTVVQPGVVRKMADRGSVSANHGDHVHLETFGGGYVHPDGTTSDDKPKVDKFLDVDGELGPKTISKWQSIVGSTVDGVISRPKSQLIYWVQRYLRDRVDSRLVADGELGPKTTRALQRYLGAPLSGTMDRTTVIALQRRLNEQRF
jgi:hypothetical protein